jgi:hypothetical protein
MRSALIIAAVIATMAITALGLFAGWAMVAMVLGMIYTAALILVLRDRVSPRVPYVPREERPPTTPLRRILVLIAWTFVLPLWLIVYGPVLLWQRIFGKPP